jgi:hypothetical protein
MKWQYDEPHSTLGEEDDAFEQLLRSKMVLLKKCQLKCEEDSHTIEGDITVANMDHITNIFVRHSSNSWGSFTDSTAQYVSSHFTSDGTPFDLFQFKLPFSISESVGAASHAEWSCNMEFAISYQVNNMETWDNNNGQNYQLHIRQLDYES